MSKTKDGFYKQIGTTEGSNSFLLLAGGDYIGFSSSSGSNTVVQRDANGFIVNSYFNTTSGGAERNASGLGYIAGFNTSDYYIRSYTSAAVKTWLGLGSNAYTSTAYLPLTGGTLTSILTIQSGNDSKIVLNNTDTETKYQQITFQQNGTEYGRLGTYGSDDLRWSNNIVLHAGNYSSYALPLSGGTMTGYLGFNSNYLQKPRADFRTTTDVYTGALTVTLPASIGNTMVSMWIDVYNYATDTSFSVHVGGYTYNNSTWANSPFGMVYGADHVIRLGHNGTNFVIYIGETNTTWHYPQVSVRDVIIGYTPSYVNWVNNFAISFNTSLSTITATLSNKAWTTKNLVNVSQLSNNSGYITSSASISGNAATATKLSSSRTFALTGDVTGTITSDLTSGVSIATTIAANSVALGTDTTGNYAASVGVSGNGLTITGSAGEGTAFTVNSNATNANTGSTLVFRDASGNFSAGTITAALSGNASTATKAVATVTGTNTIELVEGYMADNDYFRILVGGTASDAGYAEIATADGGTEPIYVRQYSGAFTSLVRTAALLDEAGNTSFPGTVTASRFACSANNLMAMKDGYLAFQTYAGGITVGCTIESPITINNSAALGTTPTTWNWRAGSSSSWANFNIGSLTANGTISASSTITTASYVSSAQGYYKSGSSNDYVLLGAGSHKSISDFRLQSEKVLKMVFRGYFVWSGTNSSPTSSNVVYSDFCTSYSISRVSTGRYRITFTGLKTTSSISADTTLQIFGAGRNINSDGTPCHVSILNVSSNYFDIITAYDASPKDTSTFTLYINQML